MKLLPSCRFLQNLAGTKKLVLLLYKPQILHVCVYDRHFKDISIELDI